MMTELLPLTEVPRVDAQLIGALEQQLQPSLSSGPALSFGVESEEGSVYRVIRTNSLWEAGRIFGLVTEMGFEIVSGVVASRPELSRVFRYRA